MSIRTIVLGSAMLISASVVMAAETIKLDTPEAWGTKSLKKAADGTLVGTRGFCFGKMFVVDPNKKYTLKLSVRAQKITGKDVSLNYAGFNVFDKNGKRIQCIESCAINGTFTTVAANAKKGDKTLLVKDGSKFKAFAWAGIVENAKADFSDLPNRSQLAYGISKVEKSGANWKITLKKGLLKDVKAGTAVREHTAGGFLYTSAGNVGANWVNWQGSMKGIAKGGSWGTVWPKGTYKAQPILLFNYNNKKLETQIKEAAIIIE